MVIRLTPKVTLRTLAAYPDMLVFYVQMFSRLNFEELIPTKLKAKAL